MQTIGDFYDSYIKNKEAFPDVNYFYNDIPQTYGDAVDLALSMPEFEIDLNKLQEAKEVLLNYHKKLGLLTPRVKENILNLEKGVVIAGQQATIFGGSGIIGNKIAALANINEISMEKGKELIPVFLVNTHDGIQPEITTIHLPNNQSSISKPIILQDAKDGVTLNTIQSNNTSWLYENLEIIKNIFNEFKTTIDKANQKLFNEKVDHVLTFLRETYRASLNLGEWVTLIWGIQANIINDWGIVFLPSSDEKIRDITTSGYEYILKNRKEYLDEFNSATFKIEEMNLRPTTAPKKNDYSPFFYECHNDGFRIKLSCNENENELQFQGFCPIDKIEYVFSVDKNNPNLSSYSKHLSPRLDTNQAILQTFLPTYIRISGPGEINYNAQVIPPIRKIGIQFPIYVKYTRMLYNTPWIEKIATNSSVEKYTLFTKDFFSFLGSIAKSRRKKEIEQLRETTFALTAFIKSRKSELEKLKGSSTHHIEKYKSYQFGMYDDRHHWQEVSWPWFIMATITGLNDCLASYKRYYSGELPIGGIGFINSRL
jgi:uncharacterized protein YllA (UPF0747 family)